MTNRPAATIGAVLDVNLLRPRKLDELADKAVYSHFRAQVLNCLYQRNYLSYYGLERIANRICK